ncbi:serine/threonine protein kinase [Gordonia alkaliphila]|uniref:serine/threonine-protein kinase n=1 Tax=Gordonia alkaliphila TaxID=1053547 RepID=UPI001FF1641F|nr:serine/threonine-protein kinase [Gordonia alkaliphila]MCK0438351.1 serine/threonine protein kinase [Gordonia alkaliphila]
MAYERIHGTDLAAHTGHGPLDPMTVGRTITEIASALDEAATHGLVHRDVKPANILIDQHDRALLTDFGIAHLTAEANELTGTGMTIGTVTYASPEQLLGQPVDARADQYSLAATAYTLLTGTPPFTSTNAASLIMAHIQQPPPRASTIAPALSPDVDTVLATALAKNPADRYPDSRTFATALTAALNTTPPTDVVAAATDQPTTTTPVDQATTHLNTPAPAPAAYVATQAGPGAIPGPPGPGGPAGPPAPPTAPTAKKSRKPAIIIGSVVGIAILVFGLLAAMQPWNSDNPGATRPGVTVSPTPPTSPELGHPDMASLATKPEDPKWVFDVPGKLTERSSVTPAGGNEKLVMISVNRDRTNTLYLLDADTGKVVRTVPVTGIENPYVHDCKNFTDPNKLICPMDTRNAYATIDLGTGAITPVPVSGDPKVVVSGNTALFLTENSITAISNTGRRLWGTPHFNELVERLPQGSPVVPVATETTLTLHDATTGKAVYTYDAIKALGPGHTSRVTWQPYADGFLIVTPGESLNDNLVEIYDAAGTKTATVENGWLPVAYDAAEGHAVVSPLPVLTNKHTNQVASVDPETGRPVVTVQLPAVATEVLGAVGTKVAVEYVSAELSLPGQTKMSQVWFDVYDGAGGTFTTHYPPRLLGTDGKRLLIEESDDFSVYETNDYSPLEAVNSQPLWEVKSTGSQDEPFVIGGKLYVANRRML